MQRKSIRATVGVDDVDIPIHTFTSGQCLVYDSGAITTEVRVSVVGSPTTGHLASWFNAETIQDSGITLADVVTNPGTSIPFNIAVFQDTTGKVITASSVLANGQAISNVTTLNARNVADFVTGPASAGSDNLASYNGATGKAIKDTGISSLIIVTSTSIDVVAGNLVEWADTSGVRIHTTSIASNTVVVGPASAVSGNIASYNGTTGKVIQDSGVLATNIVTNTLTPADQQVATFVGTTKVIRPQTLTISGGAVSNLTSINGTAIGQFVIGPGTAANNNLPAFNGTSGASILDTGIVYTSVVTTASTPSANQVATFTGTGKAIQNATVTISGGAISNVTTLNGTTVGNFVTGPASAVNFNVPCFSGTSGKVIIDGGIGINQVVIGPASSVVNRVPYFTNTSGNTVADSGLLYTDLVTSSAGGTANKIPSFTGSAKAIQATSVSLIGGAFTSVTSINGAAIGIFVTCSGVATSNQVATFTGIGVALQPVTVTISGGAITNVSTVNGVVVEAHVGRHFPGGADSLFDTSGGAWDGNDFPTYGGSGFRPVSWAAGITSSQAVGGTAVEPTGFRIIGNSRATDYLVAWDFALSLSDTSGGIEIKVFWTSGSGRAFCTLTGLGTLLFSTSGTASSFTLGATAPATVGCRCCLSVTGAGSAVNCYMTFRKTSGLGFTVVTGGFVEMRENG